MILITKKVLQICLCSLVVLTILYFYIQISAITTSIQNAQHSAAENYNVRPLWVRIDSIQPVHSSTLCLYKKPKITILVTSHVENIEARNIIRKSYPTDLFHKFDANLIFLLALPKFSNTSFNRALKNEITHHGDIVQGNFIEDYHNLTYKHLMGYKWVHNSCNSAKYVVKMDDDIVVNYYTLFEVIKKSKSNFELMGHTLAHMEPIRDPSNKWYVSETEFGQKEYPDFVSGWIYVATLRTIRAILVQADFAKFFWIDDLFVTGILREKANIPITDIKQYFRYEPKNVECCISNKYTCNFLAAPNGKNFELNLKLYNHLWECRYKKICILESNKGSSCWSSVNPFVGKNYFTFEKH